MGDGGCAPSEKTALISNGTETPEQKQGKDESKKPALSRLTNRQKIIFLLIVYGHTAIFMCVSTPFTFLTPYIVKKGGTAEDAALVANVTLIAMAISSALFGKYQVNIGTKKMFLGGLLSYMLGQSIFGVLEYAPNAMTIIAAGTVIRIIQGFGQGAYLVAALTIICQEFPNYAAAAFGIVETFAAVGYTCGPLLGSLLFSAFHALAPPFLISNVLLIPLFLAGMYLVKNYDDMRIDGAEGIISRSFIMKPAVVFLLIVVTSVYGSISTVGNVLGTLYLTNLRFSVVQIGICFLLLSFTYSLLAIIVGFIIGKGNLTRRVIGSVGILGICGMPFAFTSTLPKFGVYIVYSVLGIIYAFVLIASFGELLYLAVCDRPDSKGDFAIHSAVSGAWNMALGVGAFAYPLIGASYANFVPFKYVILADFAMGLCLALFATGVAGILQYCRNSTTKNSQGI